jgi:4-amino-4-deoxy-L-arabinose transferase-like glycosyltransferase
VIEPSGKVCGIEAAVDDPLVAGRSDEARHQWDWWRPVVVGALVPLVAFLLLRPEPFYRLSLADPFIYAGYTFAPADLIARLGFPYYAVRFGYILPANVLNEVFGVVGGYFALRWLLSAAAVAATFVALRSRYRSLVGLVAGIVLVANPIFARAMLTSYVTAIVLPATAVACSLLVMTARSRLRGLALRGAAGIAIGVAFAANPFSAFPNVVAALAVAACRGRQRWRVSLGELVALGLGAVAVVATGALVYWLRFGDPDVLGPSIRAALQYSADTVPGVEPDLHWLQFRPETWLALLAALALGLALLAARRRPRWEERALLAMPTAMWFGLAVHQFALGGYMLETYYYNSQLLPASVLAIGAALGVLAVPSARPVVEVPVDLDAGPASRSSGWPADRWLPWAALGGVAVVLGWLHLAEVDLWSVPTVVLIVAVLGAGALAARRASARRVFAAVAAGLPAMLALGAPADVPLASGQPFRQDAFYRDALFNPDTTWLRRYELADDLVAQVPRTELQPGSVVFWYREEDQLATLMQWTYLWVYTKLQQAGDPPMPKLSPGERNALLSRTPRFVVVLSSEPTLVAEGVAVLERLDLGAGTVRAGTLRRGIDSLTYAVVELTAGSCDLDGEGTATFWVDRPACPVR